MQISATEFSQVFKELLQFFKDALPTTSESAIIHQLKQMEATMAQSLAALKAEIEENKSVVDSIVVLIAGLRQQIIDAGTDPVLLAQLVADLDSQNATLAGAAVTNTSAT
jgi:hypothetical protein